MTNSRKEIKFICSYPEAEILKSNLKTFCQTQSYKVKSLYFDNLEDKLFFEKEDGINKRKKYRIRTYDNTENIFLEIKEKYKNISSKKRYKITKEQYENLLKTTPQTNIDNDLLKSFHILVKNKTLIPKIIIGYKREAFFYKQNAFRVTFDYNVKKSYNTKEFLNSNLQMQNISFENNCIIEVKYNQILPFLFKQILNSISTKRTAYSKYYNCRKIN